MRRYFPQLSFAHGAAHTIDIQLLFADWHGRRLGLRHQLSPQEHAVAAPCASWTRATRTEGQTRPGGATPSAPRSICRRTCCTCRRSPRRSSERRTSAISGILAAHDSPPGDAVAVAPGLTGVALVRGADGDWTHRRYAAWLFLGGRQSSSQWAFPEDPRGPMGDAYPITSRNRLRRRHERGSLRPRDGPRDPRRGDGLPHRLRHRRPAVLHAHLVLARGRPAVLARFLRRPHGARAGGWSAASA